MSLVIAAAGLSNTAFAGNAAQQRFAYNTEETGNAEIQYVYKVSADGQYLSHHLKYRCTYDGHRRLLMKEILRWDDASAKYCPAYALRYAYEGVPSPWSAPAGVRKTKLIRMSARRRSMRPMPTA